MPSVARIAINGVRLTAHRVDARTVSDSILTEIVQGISQDRLVFVDITTVGQLNNRPVRNGNVMYELGIAHATRLPEEVLIFRSDSEPLLFDVAGIRVNPYAPDDDPVAARQKVMGAISDAIREIDLRRSLSVQHAVEALGGDDLRVLFDASQGMKHPPLHTMGNLLANSGQLSSVRHLLDLGVIRSAIERLDPGKPDVLNERLETFATYHLTPFGQAVLQVVIDRIGFDDFRNALLSPAPID